MKRERDAGAQQPTPTLGQLLWSTATRSGGAEHSGPPVWTRPPPVHRVSRDVAWLWSTAHGHRNRAAPGSAGCGGSDLESELALVAAILARMDGRQSHHDAGAAVIDMIAASRSAGYRRDGAEHLVALLNELVAEPLDVYPAPWVVAEWLTRQATRVRADTVSQYVSRMRTLADIVAPSTAAILRHPLIGTVLEALRRRSGPPALIRGAVPLSLQQYRTLRDATTGETRLAVVLAWCGAMRLADVAAIRVGGLWLVEPGVVAIELPVSKTQQLGLPRGLEVAPPALEMAVLAPHLAPTPPQGRPYDRPPLLTDPYRKVAEALKRHVGDAYSPHSLRKGAVQHLLRRGAKLEDVPLLTLHRSLPGLMAYAGGPDAYTRATVRDLGERLHT